MGEISRSYPSSSAPSSPISSPNPRFPKKKIQRSKSSDSELESSPSWPRRSSGVMLEGYVEASGYGGDQGSDGGESVGRTKSLTDEDLEELKGCLDLGFGFSYEEIPELCNTLPALELCYSMSQKYLDEQRPAADEAAAAAGGASIASSGAPIANWKISSPGDHPEDVKARLKYWAQAVACTVRLCS
ncbi:uncharacterized protein A4U43_C09F4310 [Asparagus officinalis]|uniref:Uncharacterized protein n=1 Tax=Asparagus officinalis TaxID=4686 RepID=A0A5P1E5S3_ASPOF|nr:uncharacterized protein LOC109824346 [Asparagus officinalis]ONK57809.1 uncharacterized protein A4U43_C09F4310 [Asparagus officinalis]